jgi:hypothetical protein
MKIYHQLAVVLIMTLTMSCDFGKNNSPDHSTEGRTVPENKEITNTTNYRETGNFDTMDETTLRNGISDSLNENWNLDDPERQENLYSRFRMSQDQIQRYEKALKAWKDVEKGEAYKLLSANEKIKEEDRILKEILDASQYDQYQQWADANDLRN